jgi:hypothetical protein
MPFTQYIGVFNAGDLNTMQSVFDKLCRERNITQFDRHRRDALAAEILYFFQQGRTTEDDLLLSLARRGGI